MKKTCISFVLFLIIILSVFAIDYDAGARTEYLRIHIRADSNEAQAQAVKYEVKNAVVDLGLLVGGLYIVRVGFVRTGFVCGGAAGMG